MKNLKKINTNKARKRERRNLKFKEKSRINKLAKLSSNYNEIKVVDNAEILINPTVDLCFFKNPNEVLFLLTKIAKDVERIGNRRFYFNVVINSNYRIKPEVVFVLFAYLFHYIENFKLCKNIRLYLNSNHLDYNLFRTTGVLRYFKRNSDGADMKNFVPEGMTGYKGESTILREEIINMCEPFNKIPSLNQFGKPIKLGDALAVALGEAAGNSTGHAKFGIAPSKWWWTYCPIKSQENNATISIVIIIDFGGGVLNTVSKDGFNGFFKGLIDSGDVKAILKELFQGRYQSSTKEKNRQSGMPAIFAPALMEGISSFLCITNDVSLVSESQSIELSSISKLEFKFPGTIYSFTIHEKH